MTPVVGEGRLLQDVPNLGGIYKHTTSCLHSFWWRVQTHKEAQPLCITHDAMLTLTWAVPSYEAVTSRPSWWGLQAIPVILAV